MVGLRMFGSHTSPGFGSVSTRDGSATLRPPDGWSPVRGKHCEQHLGGNWQWRTKWLVIKELENVGVVFET